MVNNELDDFIFVFLFFLFLIIVILLVGLILKISYILRPPTQHSEKKPSFCFLPKFKTQINLSSEVLDNSDPIRALSEKLVPYGFRLTKSEKDYIKFSKGSGLGEITFSGPKIKHTLKFPIPLSQSSAVYVQYAAIAGVLFDTGDLWIITSDIKRNLEDRQNK